LADKIVRVSLMIDVRATFEAELARRGLSFTIDGDSGRHDILIGGGRLLVSLANIEREVAANGDSGRVARFVESIVASAAIDRETVNPANLYWCLEPSDYLERPEICAELSDEVDRVLCHWSPGAGLITWTSVQQLADAGLDKRAATELGFSNLRDALREAEVTVSEIDSVRLGMVATPLPFKSSLILAPNAREVLAPSLGWPLLAVAPDRDFLYLWDARHADFSGRVGSVVVREYATAAYPVSTEVWRIDDEGIKAIGAFSREDI
jgi:hypothetical protein